MTTAFTAPSVDEIIARLGAQSTCDAGLTQDPWHFDVTTPSYGPGASMMDRLPKGAPRQQMLPDEYRNASDDELQQRIRDAKARLGKKLLILGHFYQRDEIICHADFVGDSFQLAKNATQCPEAEHRYPFHSRTKRDPAEPFRRLLNGGYGQYRSGGGMLAAAG